MKFWQFLQDAYDWINKQPFLIQVVGGLAVLIIVGIFTRYMIRRGRVPQEEFPFKRLAFDQLGKYLEEEKDLTCCTNPYIPKKWEIIHAPRGGIATRRVLFYGPGETGKTRAAYEWIRGILGNEPDSEILFPTAVDMPYRIEKFTEKLKGTVVLLYDDIHESLFSSGRTQRTERGTIMSPEDRFEDLIEDIQKRCNHLYVACTSRCEQAGQGIMGHEGIWGTFRIIKLEDAPANDEIKMIRGIAGLYNVQVSDDIAREMTACNNGHSYENTVLFMQQKSGKTLTQEDLDEYKRGTSPRWESDTFYKIAEQNKLAPQLVGAMFALKFQMGLPLYRKFIIMTAKTSGLFRKRRLRKGLEFLCEHGDFRMDGDIVNCYDYQLEIESRISPEADDCLKRLFHRRYFLSEPEKRSLWDFYLSLGLDIMNRDSLKTPRKHGKDALC